jgi:Xaa-Pro aminopeptidase
MNTDYFQQRRTRLAALVKNRYPTQHGAIVLFASYENPRYPFWQDSTFYYFTGLAHEPGAVVIINLDGATRAYIPQFSGDRSQWISETISCNEQCAQNLGFTTVKPLGVSMPGYAPNQLFSYETHQYVLDDIKSELSKDGTIFIMQDKSNNNYAQLHSFNRWCVWEPTLEKKSINISPLIAQLRRKKDAQEISCIQHAIDITIKAYNESIKTIKPTAREATVESCIAAVIHNEQARYAFPPIVASGTHGTILHYEHNNHVMQADDLIIIDIGASWNGYAADLSRTYPVSGKFTKRQAFLYQTVLDTQQYVIDNIRPGIWLSNRDHPQESLHHLACTFLKKYNLDQYFVHGIGHFLGLDVHDVGDAQIALQEGDVITVEPGIYIREEGIGIRIEDNIYVTNTGAKCLSKALPSSIKDIEQL